MGETLIFTSAFSHRLVRDLAWVIASPPLVEGNFNNTHWWSESDCLQEFQACLPTLLALDKNPEPLITHLNQRKSKRLGLRFEDFVAYWLSISPRYQLLTQGLQIIEQKTTLGELDFIIKDTRNHRIIHLEVAVKFYLGTAPYQNTFRWFGTQTQDQLGKKLAHLKQQQSQTSLRFADHLKQKGYHVDERQCFLKGRLFYPSGISTPPQGVTDNHCRALWQQATQEKNQPQPAPYQLCPLEKLDWLSELTHQDLQQRKRQHHFDHSVRAQCYAIIQQQPEGKLLETARVFYLPKDFRFPEMKKT